MLLHKIILIISDVGLFCCLGVWWFFGFFFPFIILLPLITFPLHLLLLLVSKLLEASWHNF